MTEPDPPQPPTPSEPPDRTDAADPSPVAQPSDDGPGAPDASRLVISNDELDTPQVTRRLEELRAAREPEMVRSVGQPDDVTTGPWWRGNVARLALAGLLGGVLGWGLSEVMMSSSSSAGRSPAVDTVVWLALFALGLGGVMAAWEGIEARSPEKALRALGRSLPIVLGLAAIGGFIAQQAIYGPILDGAYQRTLSVETVGAAEDIMYRAVRIGRTAAFLVVGATLGAGLGAASRSGKRAINGAIGGALAGAVGGFLFDPIAEAIGGQTAVASRFFALTLTGALTGLAIGLVETARKDHWLEIVSGGMAGKQFILYHTTTTIGSAPDCHVTLIKDSAIAGHHLRLHQDGATLRLRSGEADAPTMVNGTPVQQHALQDGDLLQVGSTVLRYRQRDQAVPAMRAG